MLLIRVISYRDRPVDRELSARFGEAGGTIGRGEASTLVLPDPERHISRTHATITFQASGFVITDISTKNPTVLNGRPMGPGAQVRLADRDQIKLGGYVLEATLAPKAKLDPIPKPQPELLSPLVGQPSGPGQPWGAMIPSAPVLSDQQEKASLLGAFLNGAGIPDADQPKALTPKLMEAVGRLLREAVQGTLDLLRARALMKSELHADVTMIVPVDNNPLKFSPSVEEALGHLLVPHVRGFMPPLRAMKAAYDDLCAHQLGFLAGMRAALDEVLARFAPEALVKRLSDPTVLDSLLPMNRKAKQWDLFVEHYDQIVAEAREDFNAAFGKAFLRAYKAQVKRLRGEDDRESRPD